MLVIHPVSRTPGLARRRSRAPLRIYSPAAEDRLPQAPAKTLPPRTGELLPLGQLLPHVLARYLTQEGSK